MDQRLRKVKRSIQNVTREAFAVMVSSNATVLDNPQILGLRSANDDLAIIPDNGDMNDRDNRAGEEMGLALFGPSDKELVEQEFRKKLSSVEAELENIRNGLRSLKDGAVASSRNVNARSAADTNDADEDECPEKMSSAGTASISTAFTADQIPLLQHHIHFLQQSMEAHKLLDDIDTLSVTGYVTENIDDGGTKSSRKKNDSAAIFPFSPISVGSPSSISMSRFNFQTTTRDSYGGASPMVHAAKLVKEVETIIEKAAQLLKEELKMEGADRTGSTLSSEDWDDVNVSVAATNNSFGDDKENKLLTNSDISQMHAGILDDLRYSIRRKKMELRHRAITLLEGCVVVDEGTILVRGSSTASKDITPRNASLMNKDQDDVRGGGGIESSPNSYHTMQTSTPTNANASIPPSPLSDAYQILDLFSDSNFPTFGETLDRAIKSMSQKLFSTAFQPCLSELDSQLSVGRSLNSERGAELTLAIFKFEQKSLKNCPSSTGRRQHDAVSIKGPAVQMEWNLSTTSVSSSSLDSVRESYDAAKSVLKFVSSPESNEESLPLIPSPSVGTFISSLNLITNFCTFLHQHALLLRSDLARLMGKHLFGPYPLRTSIESGSAVLGGVLVGSAAQGETEGEERPLMTEMMKMMKKWCVPVDSSPDVWKDLKNLEHYLIQVVASFEAKMVDMGFMTAPCGNDSATPKQSAILSPSGLSVIVDRDGIGSPMNPNVSFSEDSQMAPMSTNTEKAICSPLSELANSFLQAYVETQRSNILNRGRSILLTTDYHNSVQVGTFVPEPSEPGTLESLDDDPLSVFILHQCCISTSAQKLLQLCRDTLDKATHPEAAKLLDALPPMLYRTSRELLDLFRAIIPTLYANEIGTIPRMAAILHNDCVFLAHEVSLLGVEYKVKFNIVSPSSEKDVGSPRESGSEGSPNEKNGNVTKCKAHLLSQICTFVDMVPPFRDLATKAMGSMLEVQKSQLYDLVHPRLENFEPALSSNESVMEWDDAETALRAALYHLRHLYQAWNQVLSREVYNLSMGNLVDTVFILFLDPVLKAEAITEPASRFVHSLFLDAARGASEMFYHSTLDTSSQSNTLPGKGTNMDENVKVGRKYSSLFEKLEAVGQFMIMRLNDIQRGLEEGAFRRVTAKELTHLISAAFDESPKRTALLNSLASK